MDIRDLLVRHEKLVHLNDGNNKEAARPRRPSSSASNTNKPVLADGLVAVDGAGMHGGLLPPQATTHQMQIHQPYQQPPMANTNGGPLGHDPRLASRMGACNLDVLSDAALASEVSGMQPMVTSLPQQPTSHARAKSFGESVTSGSYSDRSREDHARFAHPQTQPQHHHHQQQPQPPPHVPQQPASYDDYNVFLDDFAASPHFLPPNFESANLNSRISSKPPSQFPSRIGSLAPDMRDPDSGRNQDESRPSPLRISVADHTTMKAKVDEFLSVMPNDFVFPSRHTLVRFLEGYISGFHDQLPFLHLPTLSLVELAPELILAILAVGAQYRFESNRGYALWYAARAVATEQIRRRHSSEVHAILPNAAAYSPHSTRPSPSMSYRHSFTSGQSERPNLQDGHRDSLYVIQTPFPQTITVLLTAIFSATNTAQARLETIQAVLLLFAIGLWGVKAILHESLSLQSNLAILIREEGLCMDVNQSSIPDWESWIRREGAVRTKLIAFCFFNLCSTAYDMPPSLLTSEVHLTLPLPSRLWRAETAWQWQELRQTTSMVEITLHDAFSRLFGRTGQGLPPQLSALGNYILIHALIQHVYLLKQTAISTGSTYNTQRSLKPEDVDDVTQALQTWQMSFQQRVRLRANEISHFGGTDTITGGSLVYNATALSRLAYIRLYTDTPPSRALETRDSMLIASAMSHTPLLSRGPRLNAAVFQVVHALSTLIKAGVNYVARTKSTEWSIQHSCKRFQAWHVNSLQLNSLLTSCSMQL